MRSDGRDAGVLPPGPPLPRAVQTLGFLIARRRFVEACRRRYGDVVAFHTLLDSGFVLVSDPDVAREVFRAAPERARAGAANAGVEPLHGEASLMVLDCDEHLRQRRLMLPAFHGELMRAHEAAMEAAADREIDSWPIAKPFALLPSMYSISLEVIMRAVFGLGEEELESELARRMRAMLEAGPLTYSRSRRAAHDLILAEIARRRSAPDLGERRDVLSTMLLARDQGGRAMTDAELRDELVTLLIAGHETTATSLAWAFELLLHDPRVLARLRAGLADGDESYLDAVVKETLRLRPVASGIGRLVCERPLALNGYEVPIGYEVTTSIAAIHSRPDRYPRPEEFRPERFIEPDAPVKEAWVPFGGGTRRCLGAAFAELEMRVAIRRILERARLRPAGSRRERSVLRAVTPPTLGALGRAIRRGRRPLPRRGVRVVLVSRD